MQRRYLYKVLWLKEVTTFSIFQDWLYWEPPPTLLVPRKQEYREIGLLKGNLFERGWTSGMCVVDITGF